MFNVKAVVAAFNQEKALVGAFSVIVQPVVEPMDRFTALVSTVSSWAPGSGDPGHQLITSSHQSWVLPSRNKQVYLHTIVAMRVPPSFQFSGIKNSQKRMSREKLENE